MTKNKIQNQLTASGDGRSLLSNRQRARRPDSSSELVHLKPSPFDTRVAFRQSPALSVGVSMSSQSRCSRLYRYIFTCIAAIGLLSISKAAAQESVPHLLTLDEAVQIAIANNRSLKITSLEVDKSKWKLAEVKTKRLPSFSGTVLGSELLNEVSFSFPAGSFGTIPGGGPLPSTVTQVKRSRQPIAYVLGEAKQPLSQLYKIQLGVRAQQLGTELASQKARAEKQNLVKDVKQAYYSVLQSESELETTEARPSS